MKLLKHQRNKVKTKISIMLNFSKYLIEFHRDSQLKDLDKLVRMKGIKKC